MHLRVNKQKKLITVWSLEYFSGILGGHKLRHIYLHKME